MVTSHWQVEHPSSCAARGIRDPVFRSPYPRGAWAAILKELLFAFAFSLVVLWCDPLVAEVRLIEVRAGYEQSLAQMDSWWVKYIAKQTSLVSVHPENIGKTFEFEVEWAIDGNRALLRHELLPDRRLRGFRVTDGIKTWLYSYQPGVTRENTVWTRPFQQDDVQGYWTGGYEYLTFMENLGVCFGYDNHSFGDENLSSLLARSQAVPQREDLDDIECWRVDLEPLQRDGDEWDVRLRAWFDPRAGFLPRQIEVSNPEPGRQPSLRRIERFQKVETASGTFWFPMQWSRESSLGIDEFRVIAFRFNEPLDAALFKPKIPDGVEVAPLAGRFKRSLEQRRRERPPSGASAGVDRRKRFMEQAKVIPLDRRGGRPDVGSHLQLWLYGLAVAFLVSAGCYWFMRR